MTRNPVLKAYQNMQDAHGTPRYEAARAAWVAARHSDTATDSTPSGKTSEQMQSVWIRESRDAAHTCPYCMQPRLDRVGHQCPTIKTEPKPVSVAVQECMARLMTLARE